MGVQMTRREGALLGECLTLQITGFRQGRNHAFKVRGPILWSRLLYRTKYGLYTQIRELQSVG